MIELISLILIFIEASFSGKIFSLIVTLPFIGYLVAYKTSKIYFCIPMIILFFSFQNREIISIFSWTLVYTFIMFAILLELSYQYENILLLSIFQILFVGVIFHNYLNVWELIYNFVGFVLLNYAYTNMLKRTSGLHGK